MNRASTQKKAPAVTLVALVAGLVAMAIGSGSVAAQLVASAASRRAVAPESGRARFVSLSAHAHPHVRFLVAHAATRESPTVPRSLAPPPPPAAAVRPRSGAAPVPEARLDPKSTGLLAALRELEAEGTLAEVPRPLEGRDEALNVAEIAGSGGALALATESAGVNARKGSDGSAAVPLGTLATDGTQPVSYGEKPSPRIVLDDAGPVLAVDTLAAGAGGLT